MDSLNSNHYENDLQEMEKALTFIPPDIERHEWAKVAMAIKSTVGDSGKSMFHSWSSGGSNYVENDCNDTWNSISSDGGVTNATLFYMAKQNGYEYQRETLLITDHDYLIAKRLPSYGLSLDKNSNLHIPYSHIHSGEIKPLTSLSIWANGTKLLAKGKSKKGGFHFINGQLPEKEKPIYLAEGYATAAAIYKVTGVATASVIDSGNLPASCKAITAHWTDCEVIICADNDANNVGMNAAIKAAQATKCRIAEPLDVGYDFWDVWHKQGAEAVKERLNSPINYSLEKAIEVAPDIIPLDNLLQPVLPFDFDLLPKSIRSWVQHESIQMGCPPDFFAVSAMITAASLIGRKAVILPKQYDDKWLVVCNLWGIAIGSPSVMKSPALAAASAPLVEIERQASEQSQIEKTQHRVEAMTIKIKLDVLLAELKETIKGNGKAKDANGKEKKIKLSPEDQANEMACIQAELTKLYDTGLVSSEDDNIIPHVSPRKIVGDTTVEKLGMILNDNPNGLAVIRDELSGWIKLLEQADRAVDRAFYLEAFNGTSRVCVDRVSRPKIEIPSCVVSLMGTTQPAKVAALVNSALNNGVSDDGFLQRLQLAVWPDPTEWKHIDRVSDNSTSEAAQRAYDKLNNLPEPDDYADQSTLLKLRFDTDAQLLFNEWWKALEHKVSSTDLHPALAAHFIKYRSLMPSIALIIHVMDNDPTTPVSEMSAAMATGWIRYLESHALRMYSSGVNQEITAATSILNKRKTLTEPFTRRDVNRKGWAGLTDKRVVEMGLQELLDTNHLSAEDIVTGGKPLTEYRWNPKL